MSGQKLFLFDIDGTLIDSEHKILPSTIEALKQLTIQGHEIVLASGRNAQGIFPIVDHYNINCYYIASNGALVLDSKRDIICSNGMKIAEAKAIIKTIKDLNLDLVISFYSADGWIVEDNRNPKIIREERLTGQKSIVKDIDALEEDSIYKIYCILNPKDNNLLINVLKDKFPEYNIVNSSPIWLEINQPGTNKGVGARELAMHLNYDLEDTIAFGDSFNDLEMLKMAGLGIAMGNAYEEIKAISDYITADNDNDGIYLALKHFGFIKGKG